MKLKESLILKIFCHILLPICIIVFVLSAVIVYSDYDESKEVVEDRVQTERFTDTYLNRIGNIINNIWYEQPFYDDETLSIEANSFYNIKSTTETSDNFDDIENIIYLGERADIDYVIIDNYTGSVATTYEKTGYTDTLGKLFEKINSKITEKDSTYWVYKDGKVETSMHRLGLEEIKYKYQFESIIEDRYTVYTVLKDPDTIVYTGYTFEGTILYDMIQKGYNVAIVLLPISLVLGIMAFVYLTVSIGHKKGEEGITLNSFDKIPFEIVLAVLGMFGIFDLMFAFNIASYQSSRAWIMEMVTILVIFYVLLWIGYNTLVKRIKAKTIWKNTITCRVWEWCKKVIVELFRNLSKTLKTGIVFSIFVIVSGLSCLYMYNGSGTAFIILFVFYVAVFIQIMKVINKADEIKKAINKLYMGEKDVRLNEEEFKGELKAVAMQVNDIAAGFSNAIEENLKSERMKTELITNVSHDIKTPLTSIINYADLLKKEGLDSKKAPEYLKIIDEKSYKLKKLTEDLVEASRASSGSIKLELEKIDSNELIKQMLGDFEDNFKEKNLEVILTMPEEKAYIKADGRYISRVFQNLFCNISKYSMSNTRVYIDILKEEDKVKIKLKNISKDKLNITAEELVQRFVRGDSSRNTERKRTSDYQ